MKNLKKIPNFFKTKRGLWWSRIRMRWTRHGSSVVPTSPDDGRQFFQRSLCLGMKTIENDWYESKSLLFSFFSQKKNRYDIMENKYGVNILVILKMIVVDRNILRTIGIQNNILKTINTSNHQTWKKIYITRSILHDNDK